MPFSGYRQQAPTQQPLSLTGGVGYVDNQVRPTQFRLPSSQVRVPVRPPASAGATTTPPITSVASNVGRDPSITPYMEVGAVAAAAAAMERVEPTHPATDPDQQLFDVDAASWWSPGMQMGAGIDDGPYEGAYTYGNEDFY